MKTESYTGGRQIMATDIAEMPELWATRVADLVPGTPEFEARKKWEEIQEKAFLSSCEEKERKALRRSVYDMAEGVGLIVGTLLFCIAVVQWRDEILDFFRNILN